MNSSYEIWVGFISVYQKSLKQIFKTGFWVQNHVFRLPLAQKMVEKMEKEGKIEQDQETIIYLLILELRNNWKGNSDFLYNFFFIDNRYWLLPTHMCSLNFLIDFNKINSVTRILTFLIKSRAKGWIMYGMDT